MLITASKLECMSYFPSLILSSSVNNIQPSGMVVLLTTVSNDIPKTDKSWRFKDYRIIKNQNPTYLHRINIMTPKDSMLPLAIKVVSTSP